MTNLWPLLLLLLPPSLMAQAAPSAAPAQPSSQQPVVLDRVIAIVNGQVLLQSDVNEEKKLAALEPVRVPPGQDTDAEAANRLITRTLVLQQMKEQAQPTTVDPAQAEQGLKELRDNLNSLHACAPLSCTTEDGWAQFLKAHNISPADAEERWSQRMAIQHFIDLRFRAGIDITPEAVNNYYTHNLVPAMKSRNLPPPSLQQVTPRIKQLLMEQRVNSMIRDWIRSLRAEGSIKILVPAYGQSTTGNGSAE